MPILYLLSVFMSWLLLWDLSVPLTMGMGMGMDMGMRLGEGCWWGAGERSSSPSLLELSSPLPEQLPESEELLLQLLLICSITSTSARSSGRRGVYRELIGLTMFITRL